MTEALVRHGAVMLCLVGFCTFFLERSRADVELEALLAAWEAYRDAADLSGYRTDKRIWENNEAGDPEIRTVTRVWRAREARVVEIEARGADNSIMRTTVLGTTPSYTFNLKRVGEASPWTLMDVTVEGTDLSSSLYAPLISVSEAGSLIEVAQHPEFRIVAQKTSPDDGSLELEFAMADAREPGEKQDAGSVASGTLRLDPERHYVLRGGTIVARPKASYREVQFEYEYTEDALPIATHRRTKITYPRRTDFIEETIDSWDRTPIPEARFKLTHYGIAEPPEAKGPGSYRTPPWLYWFVGGVLLTIGGAFAIRRATRERR